ncbi:MAG: UDP-N-acetylmuramate dehydrogenase [Candidatus Gracilibacteria bacterium]|nr:UDP-N-acetylmuramate dehydrogenase [Candidatus Gracilibacteria bacterium]
MEILEYLKKDVDISGLSNFKTFAKTMFYYEIHNKQDIDKLSEIYNYSRQNNLQLLLIGGGTNLLFAFDYFNGIVVKNCLQGWDYDYETNILKSYTNERISYIALELYNSGQVLWKRFIGLPGSVGGAVFGNAGCFGLETENNFLSAEVLNMENGKIIELLKDDMMFDYRTSKIKENNNLFIISAKFDLSKLVEKYASDVDNLHFREFKQPKGNTCGSFFKNPSKEMSAGKLIEEVGLKGKKIGGAFFSELHANFLMNDGTATYIDLLELVELAQNKVKNGFNVDLIPEVRIITNK